MHNYSGCFEESGKIPGSFAISWEQRKLENILSLENGFAFQSEYFVEEKTGYVVATPGNVSVEGGFICEGGKNYSVSAPFNERFIFKSGDIFVTMTDLTPTANTLGKPAIVPDNGIIYLHNQRLGKLVDYNCNKKFLFALLCTDKYHSQIVKTASGTTVRHSSPDKILSYETFVPKFEEQKMIGKFFSNLDHFIALHQRKQCILYIMEKLLCGKSKQLEKSISWEQRKLKDVLVSLQNNTLSRADLSNEEGVAKNVHYGDVLIKFREILDVSKEKLPMISDESILSKYKASFLQNGDVIVADTAEDSTVGKCSEIAGLNDEVVLSGLHTIPYRPIEKFASGYLGYYLNSSAYHNQLIPLMQGIKVTSISKSAMQDTVIVCPKSVEEQGKIGDYLQSLDNLITLHQRKP